MTADYLTPPDVAAKYGIPLRTVQAACSTGVIRAVKMRRMWFVDPVAAQDFAQQWRPKGQGPT